MLEKITYGTTYAAVEHTSNENGNELFNILLLKKKKKELVLKEKKQIIDFGEVINFLGFQKHIFLIVNDTQVLSKSVIKDNDESLIIVRKAFPNITIDDFYYETLSNNYTSFVAIGRKDYIDQLLVNYKEKGVSVVGFSLGNLAIENLLTFINFDKLHTSNAKINFENNEIESIEKEFSTAIDYRINDLEVTSYDVLTLSGILTYFFDKNYSNGLNDKINSLRKDFQQKKFFNIGLYTFLGLLFAILLINFLVFGYYHSKVNQISSELEVLNSYKVELHELERQTIKKERLVNSLQATKNSKLSFFIDKIAQKIPETILLSELQFQPVKGRVKKGKPLLFYKDDIVIKGVAKNNDEFTSFISDLGRIKWIKSVVILNYGKDGATINSFEILIKLQNE